MNLGVLVYLDDLIVFGRSLKNMRNGWSRCLTSSKKKVWKSHLPRASLVGLLSLHNHVNHQSHLTKLTSSLWNPQTIDEKVTTQIQKSQNKCKNHNTNANQNTYTKITILMQKPQQKRKQPQHKFKCHNKQAKVTNGWRGLGEEYQGKPIKVVCVALSF